MRPNAPYFASVCPIAKEQIYIENAFPAVRLRKGSEKRVILKQHLHLSTTSHRPTWLNIHTPVGV